MNLFDLTGRVALVTGSSKGIGRGIVERFAEHGAKVIVSSRDQAACDQVAAELNETYGKGEEIAIGLAANLEEIESLEALVKNCLEKWGRIDTLICNAAVLPYIGSSAKTPPKFFTRLMEANIQNTFRLCHMVLPQMRERKDGNIIIIGSASGHNAAINEMAYGVTKAAQAHMARSLAAEVCTDNITVNCVAPGLIRSFSSTPVWENDDILESFTNKIPIQRIGEPDDIAAGCIFLSSQGGSYVTGVTINIDGGRTVLPPVNTMSKLDELYEDRNPKK